MSGRDELTAIEKLRVAAVVAPRARDDRHRSVKLVDKNGRVTREATTRELLEGVCKRVDIEFDVQTSAKPLKEKCRICGRPFLLPARGQRPTKCPTCRAKHTQTVCAGYDGPCPDQQKPGRNAFDPHRVKMRDGEPWRCRACAGRKSAAKAPGDRWSRAGRAAWAKSAEERSAHSHAIHAAQTPEKRSERQRKAAATRRRGRGS